jgi:hypothetical protein
MAKCALGVADYLCCRIAARRPMLTPLVNENIVATAVDERVPVVQHDDIHASGSEKVCD